MHDSDDPERGGAGVLRRSGRTVFIGACLLAGLTAGVIALVSSLTSGRASHTVLTSPPVASSVAEQRVEQQAEAALLAERAKIYAAVLNQHDPGQRYVIERECGDIGAHPNYRCVGQLLDPGLRRALRALAGPTVQFGPPGPRLLGGFHGEVVGFGPLALTGGRARLAMEVYDGPQCATGATYLLARRAGAWQVTGTIGPQWIS